jgi:hypothetical protein
MDVTARRAANQVKEIAADAGRHGSRSAGEAFATSTWSQRALPAATPDLLEQVDQAVDALGAGRHQPQSLDQALDVGIVQGNALHDLVVRSRRKVPYVIDMETGFTSSP